MVARVHRAEEALGRYVQAHRLPDRLWEQLAQQACAEFLVAQVLLVDLRRVFVEVADIVQQGGDYKAVRAAGALGQGRTLQRVLGLADCLAIGLGAMAGEAFGQFVEKAVTGAAHGFSPFRRRTARSCRQGCSSPR